MFTSILSSFAMMSSVRTFVAGAVFSATLYTTLKKSAKSIVVFVQIVYNNSTKKGSDSMSITATELKNNLGKYLVLSATEDIFITKNGKIIAKLTNPYQDRVETAKSLFGILPKDADLEEAKAERLITVVKKL